MAPEMIVNASLMTHNCLCGFEDPPHRHNHMVDWWALGVEALFRVFLRSVQGARIRDAQWSGVFIYTYHES